MKPDIELLLPRPLEARSTRESFAPGPEPAIAAAGPEPDTAAAVKRLSRALREAGLEPRRAVPEGARKRAAFTLGLEPAQVAGPQGYRLSIGAQGAELIGADPAGLHYAAVTLAQWLRSGGLRGRAGEARIAGLEVEDRPAIAHRGALLDVSRDKVPTLETLFELIDLLADWKLNQLQLYTEHVFAYRGHEVVWRDASPLTAEEVRQLDAFCRERHVELVPNQNSFGHFHRWLRHQPYRELAECPQGVEHPFGDAVEPFSLCPTDPGSLELLADLYDQLLPNFSSRMFNVGLDETLDLGRGRSAAACAERTVGRVYLEFLLAIRELAAARGRRIQFWADGMLRHQELIAELPTDTLPLIWGYEADHPFLEQAALFQRGGLPFYLCPGTSSWNSFGGRAENALGNLSRAALAAREAGAEGYLITDWGDFGHLQPLPVSLLGLLAGAGFAWSPAHASDLPVSRLAALLDLHAFRAPGAGLGRALVELGHVYLDAGAAVKNGSALFFLVLRPDDSLDERCYAGLTRGSLERALKRLESCSEKLAAVGSDRADLRLAADELAWVAAMLGFACRLGLARLAAGRSRALADLPPAEAPRLAAELDPLIERHREQWLARNRPGGLEDSTARLLHLRDRLRR